MNKREIQIEVN